MKVVYSLFLILIGMGIGMVLCEFGFSFSQIHDYNVVLGGFNWTSSLIPQPVEEPLNEISTSDHPVNIVVLYMRPNFGIFVDFFHRLEQDASGAPPWCDVEIRSANKSFLFEALRTIRDEDKHAYADFYLIVTESTRVHLRYLCTHASTLDPESDHFESRGLENTIGKKFAKIDLVAVSNHGILLSRKALLDLAPCHFKGQSLSDVKLSHCWNETYGHRVMRNARFASTRRDALTSLYSMEPVPCVESLDTRIHFALLTGPTYESDCQGILETWGQQVGSMTFYVHKPIDEEICNGTVTDLTPIGCCIRPGHAKGRNQQLPYWIVKYTELENMDIDWVVGFDSDSSYNIPLIAKWIPTFPLDVPMILGDITSIWKDHARYPDGAGIFINRAAIKVILENWHDVCKHENNNLDIWLGYCAMHTGIIMERLPGTFHLSIIDELPEEYWQSSYGLFALHRAYGRKKGNKKRKRASDRKYQGKYQELIQEHDPCV